MKSELNDLNGFKANRVDANRAEVLTAISSVVSKFNFDEDYLTEGELEIQSCSKINFHTCVLENFTESRSIVEENRPNKYDFLVGTKYSSEFNIWDYNISPNKQFTNSENKYIIDESHHAVGCTSCNQHGQIRCWNCRGAGENTCDSCSGKGENRCSICSGRGEIKCFWCSGKGSKETGYGDNKRIERCSSCSGRGYNPCASCRNGYETCSPCSGRGRVSCYSCHGSGNVTCNNCEGYRTMDHYFVVNAKFNNINQQFFLTNPFSGFDYSKAIELGFSIKSKLFEIKNERFKDGYFDQLQSLPLYRQICSFFDFNDSDKTKLLSSKITILENTYFEVVFSFYGEHYKIYLDEKYDKYYFDGKKPSDLYELDLLNKSLVSLDKNDLEIAKKTIEKLSEYDSININENKIIEAIEDTQSIYRAQLAIDKKQYSNAENALKSVSNHKKNEQDFSKLEKKLNFIYLINSVVIGFLCFGLILFKLQGNDSQFISKNIIFSILIIVISSIANIAIRNFFWARFIVTFAFGIQFASLIYLDSESGNNQYSREQFYVDQRNSEVTIGKQVWMTQNLNVDKFRNGDPIRHAKTKEEWIRAGENKQPAWCYYNNDSANGDRYGKLYNWYAVNDPRGLAPEGWKIPSDEDWSRLIDFLGGKDVAGTSMKFTEFWTDYKGKSAGNGSNGSGFSGLPGGYRNIMGTFYSVGIYGYWWSSTEGGTRTAWHRTLSYSNGDVSRQKSDNRLGFSVRCLRD